jgi:hypothetical protein
LKDLRIDAVARESAAVVNKKSSTASAYIGSGTCSLGSVGENLAVVNKAIIHCMITE